MKIAITADTHLNPAHQERLEAFEELLRELQRRGVGVLVVAGDLLDAGTGGSVELDELLQRYPQLQLLLLPGNHDAGLSQSHFAAANVRVFSRPALRKIDGGLLLFLPYQEGRTMGGVIEESGLADRLQPGGWILVSHGDFGAPRSAESGAEAGYFPLTRQDLQRYRPARAILGHVHAPGALEQEALSPGSPYPLSADEWGPRRLLLLETRSAYLEALPLRHTPVYQRLELFLLPDGHEREQLQGQLQEKLTGILGELQEAAAAGPAGERSGPGGAGGVKGAAASEGPGLRLRVRVEGYASSRQGIETLIQAALRKRGVALERVELDGLRVSEEEGLSLLADRVRQAVSSLQLRYPEPEALRAEVLRRACDLLYRP
jgi:hypothetical protein